MDADEHGAECENCIVVGCVISVEPRIAHVAFSFVFAFHVCAVRDATCFLVSLDVFRHPRLCTCLSISIAR